MCLKGWRADAVRTANSKASSRSAGLVTGVVGVEKEEEG
jgi:hypothetical protein